MKNIMYSILLCSVFLSNIDLTAYQRIFCNYGTVPITLNVHYRACWPKEYIVMPHTEEYSGCIEFDSGGCCISHVDASAEGYPSKTFNLDTMQVPGFHEFNSTGANISCKATRFVFWNDFTNKIISSMGTVTTDYTAPSK